MEEQQEPVALDVSEPPKKPKRVMSEAQKEGLARGRAALAAKRAAAKNIQVVPIETSDAPDEKPSKPAKPKIPDPPPPKPPSPPPIEPKAKLSKGEQKTQKAMKELPKKQISAVERDQKKYMEKETKAQLQQARRLRDAAEAREMSLNSIIEQKVAREVANYKRQERLKKAAELLKQEAEKPPIPEPRVHYEDSEEEEEIEETPERSVTFETPPQRPTSQRNPLHGRAWANDPYFEKMMARMR